MFIIPESLFTMPGIRVHVRLESVFTITRNTHRGLAAKEPGQASTGTATGWGYLSQVNS